MVLLFDSRKLQPAFGIEKAQYEMCLRDTRSQIPDLFDILTESADTDDESSDVFATIIVANWNKDAFGIVCRTSAKKPQEVNLYPRDCAYIANRAMLKAVSGNKGRSS